MNCMQSINFIVSKVMLILVLSVGLHNFLSLFDAHVTISDFSCVVFNVFLFAMETK